MVSRQPDADLCVVGSLWTALFDELLTFPGVLSACTIHPISIHLHIIYIALVID